MRMVKDIRRVTIAGLTLILLALSVSPALAHQPFFEMAA
jgi:hypothetical protein